MPKNHIVLVGNQSPTFKASSYGTGVVVSQGQVCYVVTCKHVMREAGNDSLFALPKVKKSKSPPSRYAKLILNVPKVHPLDDEYGTFDVAVSQIMQVNRQFLISHDIVPVNLSTECAFQRNENGQIVMAAGYPAEYANAEFRRNIDEPLLPKTIQGTVKTVPLSLFSQQGFDAPLREGIFAQTSSEIRKLKGLSGGIVLKNDLFAGIVLAGGDFQIYTNDNRFEVIDGFVFATAQRVVETISSF